ncbi:MAG TPA: tyrosine-type recombinase/integrase [Acidimicrobiales bacterium]
MRARGLARATIGPRSVIAREWLARHPDPAVATYRDVEVWVRDRGLAASSTRALLVNLRAFYRWLAREGLAEVDPTSLVDRPKVPARLPRPAPEREVAWLGQTACVQMRALYALMALAGLRCCECSRLDWRDVDLVAGTVIVNGKGDRERLISLSGDVVTALAALRLASGRISGAVFVGPSGRRLMPWRVSQKVNQAMRAAGLSSRAHQLRHRCATVALQEADGDLLAVRDLLGHSSVSTTQIYTACLPERTAATSRALNFPREEAA